MKRVRQFRLLCVSLIWRECWKKEEGTWPTEVVLDDKCYLYGKLPATEGKKEIPALGFIAHMDTVSDFCDHEIRPMVTENYDGGDLVLGTSGLVLSPKEFPHLTGLKRTYTAHFGWNNDSGSR